VGVIVLCAGPVLAQQEDVLPRAPLSLAASVSNNSVTLQWAANPLGLAAESFQVHAGTSPGLSNVAIITLPASVTALSATAPPGTYFVRVIAVNRFGVSGPSNEVIVRVGGDCLLPGVPTNLTAATGPGSVTLLWQSGPGSTPTGHVLAVGSSSGAANIGTFALGPATTLVSAAPAGTYFARIRATNGCGTSAPSAEVVFTVSTTTILVPAGIYDGQMFNHTRTSPGRPPITAFVLQLNTPVPTTSVIAVLSAVWTDNAGCRQSVNILGDTRALGPNIYLEQAPCNGGGADLTLNIRSQTGNTYTGVCPLGGANCSFRMTRR
jgi:hypothetical protein